MARSAYHRDKGKIKIQPEKAPDPRLLLKPVNVPDPRFLLRCHRERDLVTDIETTMAELADGVAVPSYTLRVQVLPA